jgi:hypothetical protein
MHLKFRYERRFHLAEKRILVVFPKSKAMKNLGGLHPSVTIQDDNTPCDCNQSFADYVNLNNLYALPYNPFSTNSNAFARNMLKYAGYTPPTPPVRVPGWRTTLP